MTEGNVSEISYSSVRLFKITGLMGVGVYDFTLHHTPASETECDWLRSGPRGTEEGETQLEPRASAQRREKPLFS